MNLWMCFSPVVLSTLDRYICVDKVYVTEKDPIFVIESADGEKYWSPELNIVYIWKK